MPARRRRRHYHIRCIFFFFLLSWHYAFFASGCFFQRIDRDTRRFPSSFSFFHYMDTLIISYAFLLFFDVFFFFFFSFSFSFFSSFFTPIYAYHNVIIIMERDNIRDIPVFFFCIYSAFCFNISSSFFFIFLHRMAQHGSLRFSSLTAATAIIADRDVIFFSSSCNILP